MPSIGHATNPDVSVVIAAYNARPFIGRAIASVRDQSFADWEILAVDDGSTDGTCDILESLRVDDPRIRLLRHQRNRGPAEARNTALDAARGRWIAVLDADDAWRPERLAAMLAIAGETGFDMVADNQILFDQGAGREAGVALDLTGAPVEITLEELLVTQGESAAFHLGLVKPLILRSAIVERGLRYGEGLRYCEDLHFYAQLLATGCRAMLIPQPYYVYTCPVGLESGQRSQSSRSPTDMAALIWICDDLVARYGSAMSERERAAVATLRKQARKRLHIRQMTHMKERGRFADLALFALANPLAAMRYIATSRTFRALTGRPAQRPS